MANIDKKSLEEFPEYVEAKIKHVDQVHTTTQISFIPPGTLCMSGNPTIILNQVLAIHICPF